MIDVQYQQGRIFRAFRSDIERLRDGVLKDAQPIIRREWARSVSSGPGKFYRTGAGLQSAVDEFVTVGDRKMYRLFPTAFYMIFGEYGTGQRGAASGRPAPLGYNYGGKPGMKARRFSRIAVGVARPQVDKAAISRVRRYAQNQTVN